MTIARYEVRCDGTVYNAGMPTLVGGKRKFTVTGLDPSTNYSDISVRSVSGAGIVSSWFSPVAAVDTFDPYDPMTDPDLHFMLLSDHFAGYANDDPVADETQWDDESGNDNHWAAVNPSTGIIVKTNQIDTLPAVRLTGATDTYFLGPDLYPLLQGEIFIVWKINDTTTNGGNVLGSNGDAHYPWGADGLIYDDFGATVRKTGITPTATLTNWHLMSAYSAPNDWAMYHNGVQIYHTTSNTVQFPEFDPKIGKSGQPLKADIAAVILFSKKRTAWKRAGIMAWLDAKYPSLELL